MSGRQQSLSAGPRLRPRRRACTPNRWTGAAAGLFLQLAGGTAYAWGCYSPHVKAVMGLSQTNLNTISSIGNVGMYVGIIAGLVYDRLPSAWGPQLVDGIGALLTLVGYLCVWGVARDAVASKLGVNGSVAVLSIVLAFTWNGSAWMDASAMAANIRNFGPDKGLVVGLLKAFFGLAATIISVMYVAFFDEGQILYDAKSCPEFVVVGVVFSASVFAVIPLVHVDAKGAPPALPLTKRGTMQIYGAYAAIVILAIVLTVVSVFEGQWKEEKAGAAGLREGPRPIAEYIFVGVEVAIIASLLLLPFGMRAEDEKAGFATLAAQQTRAGLVPSSIAAGSGEGAASSSYGGLEDATTPLIVGSGDERRSEGLSLAAMEHGGQGVVGEEEDEEDEEAHPLYGRDSESHSFSTADYFTSTSAVAAEAETVKSTKAAAAPLTAYERAQQGMYGNASVCFALTSLDFWLLFGGMFCVMGSALMTINNVSQMVSALGAHNGALFVSLLGISNCLGRMIAGLVANATQKYVSRPTWLVLACAVMAVAQILVITGSLVLLYPAAILTGLAYGACWSTTPPLASDIFGNKSFAAIYQFLGLAPAFGSMVCSIGIAGTLYDKFAVKATDGSGETACTGAHCFRYTCMITASMDVVAVVLIAILAFRMRRFYFPKKN